MGFPAEDLHLHPAHLAQFPVEDSPSVSFPLPPQEVSSIALSMQRKWVIICSRAAQELHFGRCLGVLDWTDLHCDMPADNQTRKILCRLA